MDKYDRMMALYKLLQGRRRPVSLHEIRRRLECSERTATRAIETLRNTLYTPVPYDRDHNGYFIDGNAGEFEIPGLWFNAQEIHALLVVDQLLSKLEPGLVRDETAPFRKRLQQLLQKLGGSDRQFHRIRLLNIGRRREQSRHFPQIAHTVLNRKRLHIRYHARSDDKISERETSPQRITHYRDNWYLDAWCHVRNQLRIFSLDRIERAQILEDPAIDIDEAELDDYYATSFGIFSGSPAHTAVLLFNAHRAQWVSNEEWHPRQQGIMHSDGRYELHIPYNRPTELIGDILKYGADVSHRPGRAT